MKKNDTITIDCPTGVKPLDFVESLIPFFSKTIFRMYTTYGLPPEESLDLISTKLRVRVWTI